MERFFYQYGRAVTKRPWLFIFLCLAITGASALGLMRMRREMNILKLWIPEDSDSRMNTEWLYNNYPPSLRYTTLVFVGDNVLKADVIRAMYRIRSEIANINTTQGTTWNSLCQKAPILRRPDISDLINLGRRRKRSAKEDDNSFDDFGDFGDFSDFDDEEDLDSLEGNLADIGEYFNVNSYPKPYCEIIERVEFACLEMSILELWANDGSYDNVTDAAIASLTDQEVLDKINNHNKSGVFLQEKNFTKMMSDFKYDDEGKIIGAGATIMTWLGDMNMTGALTNPVSDRPEPVDVRTFDFEAEMLKVMLERRDDFPPGIEAYPHARRSFGDIGLGAILGDAKILTLGYAIVFMYLLCMLGRFNFVEQRAYVSLSGIFGVVMGIIVCFGLCSAFDLVFGPMHPVLPFLLLGIGIDNMFVIVQCCDNLKDKVKPEDLETWFGLTMKHAGVAITITSLTDVVAFAIGGTTVLPALRSFCLYASVGITATYFFQCTFFLAFLSLDQRRINDQRNGCFPCIKHTNWTPNQFSQREFCRSFFRGLGNLITKPFVKGIVILVTVVITAFAIWGNVEMKQEFDPVLFLPPDSYLFQWFKYVKKLFPGEGVLVTVYMVNVDYIKDFIRIQSLARQFEAHEDVMYRVESWTLDFESYIKRNFKSEMPRIINYENQDQVDESLFRMRLGQFLFSPRGGRHRSQFFFPDGEPVCGQEATNMTLNYMRFHHQRFQDRYDFYSEYFELSQKLLLFRRASKEIHAMNKVKELINNVNLTTGKIFPFSRPYPMWETNEIIGKELYRNIGLALTCVFATTVILLANFRASVLVLGCVTLSLIDIGGFMHFWGLTIDTVSCNNLIIAIGLCVDYSSHIAHRFLIETSENGDRNERVKATLANIGPAVLNGGFTTTLAFILLANSESHVFLSFFKIFFLVVSFGLYHGLIVLPVFLSLFGPEFHVQDEANDSSDPGDNSDQEEKVKLREDEARV